MNPAIYIGLFLPLLVIFIQQRNEQKRIISRIILNKRKGDIQMLELAKRFIGKECVIYTFNSQLTGTVTEVTDGAVMLKNKNETEAINLDYVIRIREYPRNKNGKKKSVIVD